MALALWTICGLCAGTATVAAGIDWINAAIDRYKFLMLMLGGAGAIIFGIAAALFSL